MAIFGRWTATIQEDSERLDNLGRNPPGKAMQMRAGSDSLARFLHERRLIRVSDRDALERGRERVEKSGLLRLMQETCTAINELAGRTVVDAHSFLPPEPLLGCFIFVEEGSEFILRLELRGASPFLVFAERKWRDTGINDFVRWACRLIEVEPMSLSVKLIHEVQDDCVSADEIRQWFFYLISGFQRSYAPAFRQMAS